MVLWLLEKMLYTLGFDVLRFWQRLQALDDGWIELHQMWDNRQLLLSQALNHQMFLRDARQADHLLNQQDSFLAKVEQPVSWQ